MGLFVNFLDDLSCATNPVAHNFTVLEWFWISFLTDHETTLLSKQVKLIGDFRLWTDQEQKM